MEGVYSRAGVARESNTGKVKEGGGLSKAERAVGYGAERARGYRERKKVEATWEVGRWWEWLVEKSRGSGGREVEEKLEYVVRARGVERDDFST
jgi:hypothetical protein